MASLSRVIHPAGAVGRAARRIGALALSSARDTQLHNGHLDGRRRLRAITMDVTGTIVQFSGRIEDHYGAAARWCGVELSPTEVSSIPASFNQAYQETNLEHPCFGNSRMLAKEWWRICVLRCLELSGARMTKVQEEMVFQRVYSIFGSHATYQAFPDAGPFLKWAHRSGIIAGVISNADERYGDSILPMLGLSDSLCFMVFSKEVGSEKPSPAIFEEAIRAAEPWLTKEARWGADAAPLVPSEVLHIGDNFEKDYLGARNKGFQACLLDRFKNGEGDEWRAKGAPVFDDLIDVVEFFAREGFVGPKSDFRALE